MGGYKNKEGYPDPREGQGKGKGKKEGRESRRKEERKEERERNAAVTTLITMLKQIISLAGFELVGRIVLKDKVTGKEYR